MKILREKEDQELKNHRRIKTGARITLKTERTLLNKQGLLGWEFRTVYEGEQYRIYHFRRKKLLK